MSRPGWDEYFMGIALQVSERSTCVRRRTGAVIVKDKRILATGYNGAPTGLAHCEETSCIRDTKSIPSGANHELCRGIHAEQNAVVQAARFGNAIEGAIIYTTHQPCVLCAKILINAGIGSIIFAEAYPDELSGQILAEARIEVRAISGSETD